MFADEGAIATLIKRYVHAKSHSLQPTVSLQALQMIPITECSIITTSLVMPPLPSLPLLPQKTALTILRRLEAATSRLEDMVPNSGISSASANGIQSPTDQGSTGVNGTEQARGSPATLQQHLETLPPVIDDFDATINAEVKTFVNMSEEIGGLVAEQVQGIYSQVAM